MRRHILFIVAAYAVGIWMQYELQLDRMILWIALLLSFFVVLLMKGVIKFAGIFIILIIGGSILFQFYSLNQNILYKYENLDVSIEGYIVNVTEVSSSYHRIVVKTDKLITEKNVLKTNKKILVNISGEIDNFYSWVGHSIHLSGKIYIPDPNRNPGTFNYQLYLKTKNIPMIMDIKSKDIYLDKTDFKRTTKLLAQVKYGFIEDIKKVIAPEKAGVLTGILFGDKSFIDDSLYENFQKNGTAHILAVSGIHIGILYGFIEFLLRGKKNIFIDILIVFVLLFYAAISEFAPSVLRAVFMIILFVFSKKIHRKYDILSSAAFIAFLILLFNPYMLFNVGFQLSFVAVFAVGTIYPYLKKKIHIYNSFVDLFILLISIQIGTAPIIAYHFNYFSIIAFVINIPIIAYAGLILPLGFVLLTMSFVHEGLFYILAQIEEILINALIKINYVGSLIPNNSIDIISPSILSLIFFYLTVCFVISEILPPVLEKYKKEFLFLGTFLTLICFLLTPQLRINGNEIIFVDVGQGDCIHIRTPKGKNILIDGGGKEGDFYDVGTNVLLPYLFKNGVNKIDLAIITHLHADHYKGILSVINAMKVKKVALYKDTFDKNILSQIKTICAERNSTINYIKKDDRINIEQGVTFYTLYPNAGFTDIEENNNSIVMLLDYEGHKILFTGDIQEEAENKLLNNNLKAEILKVPHHGSNTSSTQDFIEAIKPQVGIIQVGKNTFGHPDKEVIKRYEDADVQILRTDHRGAVLLDIKKDKIIINTMIDGGNNEL